MATDLHDNSSHTAYFITFTCSGGEFPPEFEAALIAFHVKKCDSAIVVKEGGPGEDKNIHYHSVGTFKSSKTANVTNQCKTLYSKLNIDFERRTVQVKKVSVLVGVFSYLLKEMGDGCPLLTMGWQLSWIKEQVIANVARILYKVLMKNKHCLTAKTATAMIIEYAKAKSLVLDCKLSFAEVCCEMAEDGYQFEAVKVEWMYCQVMSMLGHRGAMRSMILNKLQFLD